ncbi:IPT/TIG domain-containing protein [Streptomyces sp. NBC_01244]|uniref:IPT/TIG domain-containing protein n=1 Tax=Streptomyces sp. NBC_01244 TaxID=2903797 RepID=UPI002E136E3E|nr:IPT/TIG domain-containing protein [Streptomyces sp. NBC_01244]
MTRTRRRIGLLLVAVFLWNLPLGHSAPRAEAAGPGHCPAGAPFVRPGSPEGEPQGQLVALQPDAGPRSGGNQVTLTGSGLSTYTRVFFGTLGADGCFAGREAPDVVVLSDTSIVALAPPWPTAATVSVYAGTDCGRLSNPLGYTYLD